MYKKRGEWVVSVKDTYHLGEIDGAVLAHIQTCPVVAVLGTAVLIWVGTEARTVQATLLMVTALPVGLGSKFVPTIVKGVPTAPEVGVKRLIVGTLGRGVTVPPVLMYSSSTQCSQSTVALVNVGTPSQVSFQVQLSRPPS